MNLRLFTLLEWLLMVLVSTILFVAFFRLNDLLFASLQHAQGINWIFLPAGFRVLLVLVLGLPGALGIVAGNLWLDQAHLQTGDLLPVLLAALVSGLGPWAVRQWMTGQRLLDHELKDITAARLLNFVLIYAAVNAIFHQFIRWNFQIANSQPWIDIWPMFMGDMVGALIVLYTFKMSLPWMRNLVRRRA